MQYFPNALNRWLKNHAHQHGADRNLRELWNIDGWQIKVFAGPAGPMLGKNSPPMTLVATFDESTLRSSKPKETWLIFPSPADPIEHDATEIGLSLSENSTEILQRILNAKDFQELACFRNPIPIGLIQSTDPNQPPWIAWQISELNNSPFPAHWELLQCVLDRLGSPPPMILNDWRKQLREWKLISEDSNIEDCICGMAHQLLVSKSGLLIPLREFQVRELRWSASGMPQTPLKTDSVTPSVRKTAGKTRRSISKLWLSLGLSTLPLGLAIGVLVSQLDSTQSRNAFEPKSHAVSEPTALSSIPNLQNPIVPPQETESQSIESANLGHIDSEPPTAAQRPIVRTELDNLTGPSSSFDPESASIESLVRNAIDADIRLASTQDPAEELPAPKEKLFETEKLHEEKADSEESALVISQATEKKEFRVGRGFSAKKAKGFFTLQLDQELQDKLHVLGPRTQELVGESSGSWKISMDKLQAELVLTIQSKPGHKWQVGYLVQIPSEQSGPPVSLGPKEPAVVLGRLAQYNQWLQQSADQWKLTASGSTKPGQPTPMQLARIYSAKQKETERAITRWRQIEQLAVVVFDSVRVQVDLQPEPAQNP